MDANRAILAAGVFLLIGTGPTSRPAGLVNQDIRAATEISAESLPSAGEAIRAGSITFSDGRVIKGGLFTLGEGLRVSAERSYDVGFVPLAYLNAIDADVVSERQGVRVLEYRFTLKDGSTFLARAGAPIYVESDGTIAGYILHKTQKSGAGEALPDMVFVKSVRFSDEPPRRAEEVSTN
jgi:hypothetical protein